MIGMPSGPTPSTGEVDIIIPVRPHRLIGNAPRGGLTSLAALVLYCLLSFLYFGLPVVAHPTSTLVGEGYDPGVYVWSLAWWPHAILHGLNPFYPHLVWSPGGMNLTWTGSIPSAALLLAPVTLLAGPEVAYNVASVLLPAIGAWSAFVLCRYVTRRIWPSLAGGYLFGFSSYVLGQQQGHFALIAIFVFPLLALVVLRFLDGQIGPRRLIVFVALLVAFEIGMSTEIAFTLTVALAAGFGLTCAFAPGRRPQMRSLLAALAGGYVLAAILVSPFLYYALSGFQTSAINVVSAFPGDVANLIVPTGLIELSGSWANTTATHFLGNTAEEDLYLGLPTLLIAVLFLRETWKRPGARILGAGLVIAVVASFGSGIYVRGNRIAAGPWALVQHLPFFDNVISARLAAYSALVAALIVACWGASGRISPFIRGLLVALAVVSQVPNSFTRTPWKARLDLPAFFATNGAYHRCLSPDDNVLVLSYFSYALIWQANDGFRYRLAAPYLASQAPPRLRNNKVVAAITGGFVPQGGGRAIVRTARAIGATVIVIENGEEPWPTLVSHVLQARSVGGVLFYRLSGRDPAAGCSAQAPPRRALSH